MRQNLILAVSAALVLLFLPMLILGTPSPVAQSYNKSVTDEETQAPTPTNADTGEDSEKDGTVSVFLSASKTVVTVSDFEYTCGSVAAEMPLTYHEEALKAQAVAVLTNAKRLSQSKGDESLKGADISDDTGVHQGYMSKEDRKEKWGDSYEKYESRLEAAVKAVEGRVLTYDGELITAAFSAMSTGVTESAKVCWGSEVPYLVSVRSSGDTLSPSYSSTATFTKAQFISRANSLGADISEKDDLTKLLGKAETSKAGTVTSIKIGGKVLTGKDIREAFGLRSPAFSVTAAKNTVTFSVRGYGHGVGMSQYGADYSARQGSTYDEILKHYYKGAQIQ